MNRFSFICWAMLIAGCCKAASTIDINGLQCPVDTVECYPVGPGTVYTHFRVTIGSTQHSLYLLTADLGNAYLKVEECQANDQMGTTETLLSAHHRIDSMGHRPIGSVNCNFWCVGANISGPESEYAGLLGQPFSGTAKDGMLIGNPSNWNAQGDRGYLMIDALHRALIRNMAWSGRVSKGADKGRAIRDCNRQRNNPHANEIALFNRYIGKTRAIPDTALELVFEPIAGQEWAINDTMQCVVRSRNHSGGTVLTGQMGALQGRGERGRWMDANLQVGNTFQMKLGMYAASETADDNVSGDSIAPQVMQMVTGNCLVMAHGVLTSRNTNEGYNNQNYPRTMLATNDEGNRLWMLVSQSPGNYTAEMCALLRHDGATWAAGMDGGGSAQINVNGAYPFISKDGTPRPVANQLFLVSTAPDDEAVAELLPVERQDIVVPSYGTYTPQVRAYNQYGVLLSNDYTGWTLSCEPASLGSIAADGRTFVAGPEAGEGVLTIQTGAVSVSKTIRVEAGEVALRLDTVLIDQRSYTIEAHSITSKQTFPVDASHFAWSVDTPAVCEVSAEGQLRGTQTGETDIHGLLGEKETTMHVRVQIPTAEVMTSTAFLKDDTLAWTLKNGSKPITWGEQAGVATLNFSLASARNPQISLTGAWPLYSLPDSIELLVKSPVTLKSVGLLGKAHNSNTTLTASLTTETKAGEQGRYVAAITQLGVDTADMGIWPLTLTKIVLTLTDVKINTPYVLELQGLRLIYNHYQAPSALLPQERTDAETRKCLQDGRLYILKNGKRYDALGREQ